MPVAIRPRGIVRRPSDFKFELQQIRLPAPALPRDPGAAQQGRPLVDRVRRQPTSRSGSPGLLIHRGDRFWAAKGPARPNLETGLVFGDSQPGGGPGEPTAFAAGAHRRSPFRTAGIAWRDNRRPQLGLSCKRLVSASVSQSPSPKTPRNREFFRVARRCAVKVSDPEDSMAVGGVMGQPVSSGIAPQPQPVSQQVGGVEGELVSGVDPCLAGKVQGTSPKSGSYKRIASEIPKPFRRPIEGFPVIGNRELILTNRESAGISRGL